MSVSKNNLAKWLEKLQDVKTRHAYLAADFENYKRCTASIDWRMRYGK